MAEAKRARRMALVAAAGGVEPLGTGSPCADCGAPRTALNTGVCWSDTATFMDNPAFRPDSEGWKLIDNERIRGNSPPVRSRSGLPELEC